MKYFYLFLFTLMYNFILAQQVPNGDFEQWYNESNYQNPTYWDTPNSTTGSLGIFCVSKETGIVQYGSSSIKIESKSIFGTPIPGLATLGDFNVNIITFVSTIEGGYPFTYKPSVLKGYYQYEPMYGDQAFIGVLLLKQNGNVWDTLAQGNFKTTNTALTWTPFTVTLNYTNYQDTPTHLNIIMLSSDKDAPQPNSILYVDNLTFEYPLDINIQHAYQAKVFSCEKNIFIQDLIGESKIEVYNEIGQLIKHIITNDNLIKINTENSGFYIVKLNNRNNSFITKVMVK
ncbi:MAG: PCMD domain-containing protein [Bacteroidales bacterium]|nr:PCMD domain-containing protein [Bacteroidales bacterium]